MARMHWFEWEDMPWCPKVLRDHLTDHLQFHVGRAYRNCAGLLAEQLRQSGERHIVDMCSGGGGPIPALLPLVETELGEPVSATLTDLYPNEQAFRAIESASGGRIRGRHESASAFDMPRELTGMRTIFTALHHFRPEQVEQIFADACRKKMPFLALEASDRSLRYLFAGPLAMLVSCLLLTPFIGRVSIGRLLLTYVFPLAPLMFIWDAFVSGLRTYSPAEIEGLTRDLHQDGYKWECGQVRARHLGLPFCITWIRGVPGFGRLRENADDMQAIEDRIAEPGMSHEAQLDALRKH